MAFTQLNGKRVSLLPLLKEHAEPLFSCSSDPAIWSNYPMVIRSLQEMERFVEAALNSRSEGDQYPYAVFDNELNKIVGTTRYLRISERHRNLNIGSTWYTPEVWRTRVNTECKFLLLQFAFEQWEAVRVELITTPDNVRSQKAIERLGAVKEGLFRKKYNQRNYVVYSITDEEWPAAKDRLAGFLNR
ncbi:GNAT family N-acetyltransferase [Paenibacillus arenilitoris]|uniref:GNAT family N-acetyltransferase n=1 Tax=Paenibacillus arenilitoris TaxID=2772299 RepID=A0A927CS42_9BACL|nr:GNAT family protein [Paenibacillus arenilitoris]MBD2871206.1 GNAT family N-acetyltransferase [Paenibacillus arenilitoris]